MSTVYKVPVYVPLWMRKPLAERPRLFCNSARRDSLPRFILFSRVLYSAAEPRSLFCFDVYKPAKPQTPVQVRSSINGARRCSRASLLSFACSLSPPLSLSLTSSVASPRPPPFHPPPPPLKRRADVYPCASPLIGYPGCEWQLSPALLRAHGALLPAVPIG